MPFHPTHANPPPTLAPWIVGGQLFGYSQGALTAPRAVWLIFQGNAGQTGPRGYSKRISPFDSLDMFDHCGAAPCLRPRTWRRLRPPARHKVEPNRPNLNRCEPDHSPAPPPHFFGFFFAAALLVSAVDSRDFIAACKVASSSPGCWALSAAASRS